MLRRAEVQRWADVYITHEIRRRLPEVSEEKYSRQRADEVILLLLDSLRRALEAGSQKEKPSELFLWAFGEILLSSYPKVYIRFLDTWERLRRFGETRSAEDRMALVSRGLL